MVIRKSGLRRALTGAPPDVSTPAGLWGRLEYILQLEEDDPVVIIGFERDRCPVDVVEEIKIFSRLRVLMLQGVAIDDSILAAVSHCEGLTNLELHGGTLTDEGMCLLRRLRNLRYLAVTDAKVGDDGVKALASLPMLEEVELVNTRVTDKGLMLISKSPRLRTIDVSYTDVTSKGVESFARANPSVEIVCRSTP